MATLVDRINEVIDAWNKAIEVQNYDQAVEILKQGAEGFADAPEIAKSILKFIDLTREWQQNNYRPL